MFKRYVFQFWSFDIKLWKMWYTRIKNFLVYIYNKAILIEKFSIQLKTIDMNLMIFISL